MLSKYINQFMNDNDLSVNEEFFIYSEGVHAFVKCKVCAACGPMPEVDYCHAISGKPGRLKAINKAIELAVKGWNCRDGRKTNG